MFVWVYVCKTVWALCCISCVFNYCWSVYFVHICLERPVEESWLETAPTPNNNHTKQYGLDLSRRTKVTFCFTYSMTDTSYKGNDCLDVTPRLRFFLKGDAEWNSPRDETTNQRIIFWPDARFTHERSDYHLWVKVFRPGSTDLELCFTEHSQSRQLF